MNIAAKLYERLIADDDLQGLLSTYRGQPAVFTGDPVPEDATLPFLLVTLDDDSPYGAKNEIGRDVRYRLRVIDDAGSVERVDEILAALFRLLHRQPLDLGPDWDNYVADVDGPMPSPTDPDLLGRALVDRLLIKET